MNQPTAIPNWGDHRKHLDRIGEAALSAVNPEQIVSSNISVEDDRLRILDAVIPLGSSSQVFVVGAGKAGRGMAQAVEEVLGDRITTGVIAIPTPLEQASSRIEFVVGGHPVPNEGSIRAGVKMATLLERTRAGDLVIVLISGGGSALLEYPEDGIRLADLSALNNLLLKSGAPIHEVNTVRRQLSKIKGGGLARMAVPAEIITLILSDVVGDPLSDIASGPTVKDKTSAEDALSILDKYQLTELVPRVILSTLYMKAEGPSANGESFHGRNSLHPYNFLVGNNKIAADAARETAREIGFKSLVVTTTMQGEAAEMGRVIAALLDCVHASHDSGVEPTCLILGGETTVTVRGDGIGGRNQEMALAAALELDQTDSVVLMTLATDGVDGPTPAAGAIVSGETLSKAYDKGLDPSDHLANNDSHSFFSKLGDTINIGPSGTNVNDLVFGLVY